MNGAASDANAGLQGLSLGVDALEGGQERRMDVEHATAPQPRQLRRQDAHEAGQADQLDAVPLQRLVHGHVEVEPLGVAPVVQRHCLDSGGRGPFQTGHSGHVGEDEDDAVGRGRARTRRVDQRLWGRYIGTFRWN